MKKQESSINILVVDDEADTRTLMKRTLERHGYSVMTAEDGAEALHKVRESNIHIVLCDICMPTMDGMEFLQKVHQYDMAVEVIMITGQSTLQRCLQSIEYGACGYLLKPITVEQVLEHIQRAQRNILEKMEMIKSAFAHNKKEK